MKTCTKCKQTLAFDAFAKIRQSKDGLAYRCRVCTAEQKAQHYAANRERILEEQRRDREENPEKHSERSRRYYKKNSEAIKEKVKLYREENLEQVKESQRAFRDKRREENPEGVREYNARYYDGNVEKMKDRSRQWHEDNLEHAHAYGRQWNKDNPDKRREQNRRSKAVRRVREAEQLGWLPEGYEALLYEKQLGLCGHCLTPLELEQGQMHLDHVQPLSKGGKHDYANVALSCAPCNLRKHAKYWFPMIWLLEEKM